MHAIFTNCGFQWLISVCSTDQGTSPRMIKPRAGCVSNNTAVYAPTKFLKSQFTELTVLVWPQTIFFQFCWGWTHEFRRARLALQRLASFTITLGCPSSRVNDASCTLYTAASAGGIGILYWGCLSGVKVKDVDSTLNSQRSRNIYMDDVSSVQKDKCRCFRLSEIS